MKKKVIIFYISKYSGHFHAARALETGLLQAVDDIEIRKINAFSYTNPILERIINKAYIEVIKKKPEIWGHMYDNPDVMKKTKKAREALHRFNMSKIQKLLNAHCPDVIFCTQAFPCGMVADYKRSCGKRIPLIGILTDHAPHSYWLFDEVDFYIVPFAETGDALVKKGVPPEKIKVYGIPVDPKFSVSQDIRRIKENLGLQEGQHIVLIMGGTQGLGAIEKVTKALLSKEGQNYQILVITGANKKLYARLKRMKNKNKRDNVLILPYVENIDELMEVADLIITKAGGMTIAETLVKKLPMLIVNPIPGHERMNTDYLVGKGVAIEIKDYDHINETIEDIFNSEGMLNQMRERIEKLSRPNSTFDIAKFIFESKKQCV